MDRRRRECIEVEIGDRLDPRVIRMLQRRLHGMTLVFHGDEVRSLVWCIGGPIAHSLPDPGLLLTAYYADVKERLLRDLERQQHRHQS